MVVTGCDSMKPPYCFVCGKRIPNESLYKEGQGLIEFAKTESDLKWDKNHKPEHPPYAEWFCAIHHARAKSLSNLTRAEAVKALTAEFGPLPHP